ncbi:DHS-like NAD/FAD-binding domain-containing protein, partial [Ascobolus immersus RN42]
MPTVTVSGSGDDQRALQSIADTVARSKKVIFVTGAGISTNSGIPDFRSQDGLYNLVKRKYPQANLAKGKDLFDSVLWNDATTTSIFYTFIAELRNEVLKVKDTTCTHKFIRTLSDTGRLQRCYTQNIDGLEEREGLTTDLSLGKGKRRTCAAKKVVVQLHGHLRNLRCELCNASHPYDEENAEALSAGMAPACPTCQGKLEERESAGKRTTRIGALRPSIVLYGEENPDAEMIGKVTQADLSAKPDLMIIAGTSLKVHGLKRIVKSFAASIHAKGGKVIYVNNTPAANSVWKDVIDYHVEMDCDRFVAELKDKRPDIWQLQSTL